MADTAALRSDLGPSAPSPTLDAPATHRFNAKAAAIASSRPSLNPSTTAPGDDALSPNALPPRLWLAPLSDLRYSIARNEPMGSLPVYTKVRPAKKSVWTVVRKIHGDMEQLRQHLEMDFPKGQPFIRHRARQVLLRGRVAREVKLWLTDHGF